MIKHIRPDMTEDIREEWPTLDEGVQVELTSEDSEWPIEHALKGQDSSGWRARTSGSQTIVLTWPAPIAIRKIRLVFEEHSRARTQEFVLRATTSEGTRDVVRQQFTFSPPYTSVEREDYSTNLEAVSRLELVITPSIDRDEAVASLREWRIG